MKKTIFLFLTAFVLSLGAKAQHFDQYFEDKTVRINYMHIGNAHSECIRSDQYKVGDGWYGTRAFWKSPIIMETSWWRCLTLSATS